MTGKRIASLVLALGALFGCGQSVYFEDARAFPAGCLDVGLAEVQCQVLVDEAQAKLGIEKSSIDRIDMLTEDRCGPAREVLCTRSLSFAGGVRFHLVDGSDRWATVVSCPSGSPRMYCLVDSAVGLAPDQASTRSGGGVQPELGVASGWRKGSPG